MYHKYKNSAQFLCVYISEAHPTDEWPLYTGICFRQPRTLEERVKVAEDYRAKHNVTMPLVVDLIDNNVNNKFFAWPERIYVIHHKRIVYQGGKGPDGYHPEQLEDWLEAYSRTQSK